MLSFWSTKPAGTYRHAWSYRPTLQSSRCHPNVPSSTPLRTYGSSCETTGFQTESSNHTTISSTIVARPGISLSISLGASCLSDCANGRTSCDHGTRYKTNRHCLAHGKQPSVCHLESRHRRFGNLEGSV